jgi:hypothetical protein
MRRSSGPSETQLTVGALEAFLRDHDVPPDAEVRLRRPGDTHAASITPTWDPRAQVLILVEDDPAQRPRPESSRGSHTP